jgi:ubiquinone/menaquinone biosynthesis C-methylase UbiE
MAMEGPIARWYAKNARRDQQFVELASRIRSLLPAGGLVLEVAPGPGYLAVELAKRQLQVVGLDISKTFVEIAQANAAQEEVKVEFRVGNASAMPFAADVFDFIVCCAAFKNFSEPVQAIDEMHRVLKPGGKALIVDLRRDASAEGIKTEVEGMGMNWINTLLTKWTFKNMLLKRAYSPDDIRHFVAQSAFGRCEIDLDAIGMEIWLVK